MLIEIGCVVTSLVVGWLVGWLVVTRVHCGQTVHPRPIVTIIIISLLRTKAAIKRKDYKKHIKT